MDNTSGNKKRILIVEDERPIAKALQLKLNSVGFDAEIAFNGQDGIDMIKNKNFELILLDMVMPVKGGFSVLEEMHSSNITIPVIVTSNLSQSEDINRAKSLGAKAFVVKSDNPLSDIVNLVNKVLS